LAEAIKSNPDVYIEEIKVDKAAGVLHRTVLINGEARKDSGDVKLGVEHDGHSGDGRAAKVWHRITTFKSSSLQIVFVEANGRGY
jgi:hypothetical protein